MANLFERNMLKTDLGQSLLVLSLLCLTRISAGENQLTFLAFQSGLWKLKDQWEVL